MSLFNNLFRNLNLFKTKVNQVLYLGPEVVLFNTKGDIFHNGYTVSKGNTKVMNPRKKINILNPSQNIS